MTQFTYTDNEYYWLECLFQWARVDRTYYPRGHREEIAIFRAQGEDETADEIECDFSFGEDAV